VVVEADDRAVAVDRDPLLREATEDELLHLVLGHGLPAPERAVHEGERVVLDPLDAHAGLAVTLDPFVAADGLELLDEVGGGYDLVAEGAYEVDGPGIDDGDVRDVVERRVLHSDAVRRRQDRAELLVQLAPRQVELLLPGSGSSFRGSTRWESFTGSPAAGTK